MITKNRREELGQQPLPEGCVGYDCEGVVIKEGDEVEVVAEEMERARHPAYMFCQIGKRGTAHKHDCFPRASLVSVAFEGNGTVWCSDCHVRLVESPE